MAGVDPCDLIDDPTDRATPGDVIAFAFDAGRHPNAGTKRFEVTSGQDPRLPPHRYKCRRVDGDTDTEVIVGADVGAVWFADSATSGDRDPARGANVYGGTVTAIERGTVGE